MKLKELHIENFLTIGEAKLSLDDRGLLLIQGVNNDDTSAKSNGAGKSSVVDAIAWVNFGETARGVSGDDVVNAVVGKNCRVKAVYIDGTDILCVVRHRKHKEGKNSLRLLFNGMDITKGTDKETQAEFARIFGCSAEVFNAAVYAGQERMPDLPNMTDKQLKLLIEEAAGTEILSAAYAIANSHVLAQQRVVTVAANALNEANAELRRCEESIEHASACQKDWEVKRAERVTEQLTLLKPLIEAIRREQAGKATLLSLEVAEAKVAELKASLAGYDDAMAEVTRLQGAFNTASHMQARQEANTRALLSTRDRAQEAFTNARASIGKPCSECDKPYTEHDLEGTIAIRSDRLRVANEDLSKAAITLKSAKAATDAASEALEAAKLKVPDVTATNAAIDELLKVINAHTSLNRSIEANLRLAKTLNDTGAKIKEEVNPWIEELKRVEKSFDATTVRLSGLETALRDQEARLQVAQDAAKVFSPAGVRAHILDTVTPALNEWTKDYLGALADGNLHATWNTLGKTAKGEVREKFQIEVTNDKGGKSFAALSGGEKRKVRMACALAMQDLVASRATKPIDLFIADEVDQAMDEAGLERVMGIFERKARERGTVLVISHNSLADWIDQVITVEKTGGVSKVTGSVSGEAEW